MTYQTRDEIEAEIIKIKDRIRDAQDRRDRLACPIDYLIANDNVHALIHDLGAVRSILCRFEYR